jgi:hypothetical protein
VNQPLPQRTGKAAKNSAQEANRRVANKRGKKARKEGAP